ncbi:hypothetical protein ACTXM3_09195 [Glutamicibacter arilaitensis]|uniref:hypothetical protein n=1 Tax=Glutamicibacter arilaitensis TaxID=256701 RepID=UPI003FD447A4
MKPKAIWARLIGTLSVLAMLLGASVIPASASTVSVAPPAVSKVMVPLSVCASNGYQGSENSQLLPINRWSDASSKMFTALLSQHHIRNSSDQVSRETITGGLMQLGNTMFKGATEFMTFSANFCFMDKAGGTIDNIVGSVGKKLFSSEVMAFTMVGILVFGFWSIRRSGAFDFKLVLSKIAIMGLIFFMSTQSVASTGGGAGKGTETGYDYKPAVGSFGWTMVTANNTLSTILATPAGMFETGINGEDDVFGEGRDISSNTNPLSCSIYVKEMRNEFKGKYPQNLYGMNAGMPMMMDSMWQEMGLRAFRTSSFGYNLPNPSNASIAYDDQAWCRLLEWNAGIPGTVGYDDAKQINGNGGLNAQADRVPKGSGDLQDGLSQRHAFWKAGLGDSLPTAPGIKIDNSVLGKSEGEERWPAAWQGVAFNPGTTNEWQRSLIAWSACELIEGKPAGKSESWKIRGDFQQVFDQQKFPEECASWFRGESNAKKFEFPTTKAEVDEKVAKANGNPALAKYIATINGNENNQSMASAGVYVVSSFVVSVVFSLFALINLVAQTLLGFLAVGLFAGLLLYLVSKSGIPSGLQKTIKMAFSVILVTSFFGFLVSLVALLSRIMQSLGSLILTEGTIIHLIWMGLSPVLAFFLLHLMFKMFKIPSPLTVNGAKQWANAAGTGMVAGSVGAGLRQIRRGGRRALSRGDRRALMGKSRKPGVLKRIKNRANRSSTGEGDVGEDGVNRRLHSKNRDELSNPDGSEGGESSSGEKSETTGNKFSSREKIGHQNPSTDQQFREKTQNGEFNQLDLQKSGLDTFEAGRTVASNFNPDEVAGIKERRELKKAALTERGLAMDEALQNPNLSEAERKALKRQSHLDRGLRGRAKHNIERIKHGASATFATVRRLPRTATSKESWKTGAKKVGSLAKRGLNKGTVKSVHALRGKFGRFIKDPGGSMARGAVKLGQVAKTTAKYSAIGAGLTAATVLTGGLGVPLIAGGIMAVRKAPSFIRKRQARREERQDIVRKHVSGYRSARNISSEDMGPQRKPESFEGHGSNYDWQDDPNYPEPYEQYGGGEPNYPEPYEQYGGGEPNYPEPYEQYGGGEPNYPEPYEQQRHSDPHPGQQPDGPFREPRPQESPEPTGRYKKPREHTREQRPDPLRPKAQEREHTRRPVVSKDAEELRSKTTSRRNAFNQRRRGNGSKTFSHLGSIKHAGNPRRIID